ncbi:DUF6508 domain-containing protein [Brachyspira catarrhinii]|uniref:Uncharacterized protein n=1 Tax=Brachyspira catarrhinii TaxID=2528966 RepID=A0ABY2TSI9_9SPIR|nr:DUF6508 domain-containing protein [Brachyspira catarrhinii]TKZ35785.1 hypothetical protein EZH24_03490 [Brachyspira catarrhinii]
MGRFEILTKHIEPLKNEKEYSNPLNNKEGWFIYGEYADTVKSFIDDFYNFIDYDNNDMDFEIRNYMSTVNNIMPESGHVKDINISLLDAKSVVALITRCIRGERFCGGLLSGVLKSGFILKLLERLKEIDESQN